MNLELQGKRAVVFGASSGIGLGIAEALHRENVKTIISARNASRLRAVTDRLHEVTSIVGDQDKVSDTSRVVREAIQRLGGLDILVLNTGGPPTGSFESTSLKAWETGIQSLFLSVIEGAQAALPTMKSQKFGRILLVASISAREPILGLTISNAMRSGLLGLLKSLSNEVASFGITVNSILPGFINTDRLKELGKSEAELVSSIPAGHLGDVSDIGNLAAFLCSTKARYITGQAIACDGGRLKST